MSEQIASQTSSIGAAWPPLPSSHNRLRGFYNTVVSTPSEVDTFLSEFNDCRQELAQDPKLDRLTIRVVGNISIAGVLESAGVQVEGALPIAGSINNAIIYTAWNQPHRTASPEHIDRHSASLSNVIKHPLDLRDRTSVLKNMGYAPRVIDARTRDEVSDSTIEQFTTLYDAFGYNQPDVEELLLNSNNTVAYIENCGRVVSTALVEAATIEMDGSEPLHIAEVTEAITSPDYRGMGLYKAVSGFLTHQVLSERVQGTRPLHVLYGESNLAARGVLMAAHENGRLFSHFDRERFAINSTSFGILQQNFHVQDGVETRTYNDFALSYIPLDV